jgi:hypothetical protein
MDPFPRLPDLPVPDLPDLPDLPVPDLPDLPDLSSVALVMLWTVGLIIYVVRDPGLPPFPTRRDRYRYAVTPLLWIGSFLLWLYWP